MRRPKKAPQEEGVIQLPDSPEEDTPQGGLDIEVLGHNDAESDNALAEWDTSQAVIDQLCLEKIGPEWRLALPPGDRLMNMASNEYANLHVRALGYLTYVQSACSRTANRAMQYRNALDEEEAKVRRDAKALPRDKRLTVEEVGDVLKTHPRVKQIKLEQQAIEQRLALLRTEEKIADNIRGVVSRLIEERRNENSGERREHNAKYNNKPWTNR